MHCTRCYRFIEPGADACDGCGFPAPRPPGTDDRSSTPTAAYGGYGGYAAAPYEPSDRSAPSGPYGQYGPSGPYGQYGQYGQYGPSGASGPYGIRPPAGAPPAYGPPPRPTEKISSGRLVVIALVSGAAILLLTVVLLGRQPADRQSGSRRLPAPPSTMRRIPQAPARPATPATPTTPSTSKAPTPPQPALTFDEAVLAANNLGNAPIDVRDSGTHPTADDVLRLLVEPGDGHETEATVIRDAIHRSATLADGTMVDLTVVDLQDDAAAVTLVDDVRRHSVLGVSSPEPELAGAVALSRAAPGRATTIVVPQRNFAIVVTVVWSEGTTPGSPSTPTGQHPLAVATLQSKSLACAPENPYSRAPGC